MRQDGPMHWLEEVRAAVDAKLEQSFTTRKGDDAASAPEAALVLAGLEALTMRGGKRLRPALLVAAQRAVNPHAELADVVAACAALEVLQSYLLIHDDWMDGDVQRRGGPAIHCWLRDQLRTTTSLEPQAAASIDHLGDSLAILAGDLGAAFASDLMLESARRSTRGLEALGSFYTMQRDVVYGQAMDLLGARDVSRMQRLKTGSYTVDGPLRLGALLGDATAAQLGVLERFAAPLGEAFQVRDDLLGTFGDSAVTGKPIGNDLRAGKRTAIIAELGTLPAAVERVFNQLDADEAHVRRAIEALEASGVRSRVEAKLDALVAQAVDALEGAPLVLGGTALLRSLAHLLAARER